MSDVWTSFEHKIWQQLKEHNLDSHDQFILAVSGGLDSRVLLEVFLKLKPQAQFKVAHYHHGPSDDLALVGYRSDAQTMVKSRVAEINKKNVIFFSEKSESYLSSEAKMRASRWDFIQSLKKTNEVIVTAHHLDDSFETMLLKMIRGASVEGLLAFKVWNQEIFRPFLECTKSDLIKYAQANKIKWVSDPSNNEDHYLRNWLRETWLMDLDQKVGQGSKNLAKSLFKINSALSERPILELVYASPSQLSCLSRGWYVSLSKSDQLRSLALFLKKHQIFEFTTGQLEEIRKRLDKNQKDLTFELLGKKWVINASQIMLQ